jgi:hypothetical protein
VLLRSLREGIDYPTATGRMLAGIFAALAAYARDPIHERHRRRERGRPRSRRHTSRLPRLTTDHVRQRRTLRANGELTSSRVASYGVSRATIYHAPAGAPRRHLPSGGMTTAGREYLDRGWGKSRLQTERWRALQTPSSAHDFRTIIRARSHPGHDAGKPDTLAVSENDP